MSLSDISTPRQGIHAHRIPILDIATVDTVGTLALAYGISKYMDWPFLATTVGTFAAGIGVHHVMKIDSPLHNKVMELLGITMEHNNEEMPRQYVKGSCPMQRVWNSAAQSC
jgi:hypothetical protein